MPEKVSSNLKQKSAKSQSLSFLQTSFNLEKKSCIPDLENYYHNEFTKRIEEIKSYQRSIFTKANRIILKTVNIEKISGKKGANARINGFEIAQLQPTKENLKLVHELEANPFDHNLRILLISHIVKSGRHLDLDARRKILMQVAIPLGLGFVDVNNVKWLISCFKLYRNALVSFFRNTIIKIENQVGVKNKEKKLKELTQNENLLKKCIKCKPKKTSIG